MVSTDELYWTLMQQFGFLKIQAACPSTLLLSTMDMYVIKLTSFDSTAWCSPTQAYNDQKGYIIWVKINELMKPTGIITSVEMFSSKALYGVCIILFSPDETSTCYASPHPFLLLSGTWTLNTNVYAWLTNFSVPNTAALPTLGCARWWPSIYTYGGHIGRATLFFWGRHMAGTNYTAPLV